MRKTMLAAMVIGAMGLTTGAQAATTTEVVTEADVTRQAEDTFPTDDWVLYTRAGTPPAAAEFVADDDAPLGDGSLQLTTATGDEKVYLFNYDHVDTALGDVEEISYSTNRVQGSLQQDTAVNLQVDFNGPEVEGGFTTLVYEPVYNTSQGAVVDGEWQTWDGTGDAVWWSTRAINGQCAGAAVTCFRTWDEIVANNPDATILAGVGVNQGSGNGGLTTNVDAFTFDETTYDFELIHDSDEDGIEDTAPPTDPEQCKKGGYEDFNNPSFRNQGQCVSYVVSNR